MATYVNDLRLKEISTGDESGTWGTSTNTNLELIGEALGYATQEVFSSDADATTTVADGASDPARAMYFKITSAGSLTATRTCTIAPNTVSRVMFIENATSGSQSIAISQGSGANVTIAAGKTAVVYLDGAGSTAAVVDAMAGVDPGVTDTLAEVLTAGNTSGGTNIELSTTDKAQFRDSAIYINSSADGQLDLVADTEIQIAATTVDLNGNLDVSGTTVSAGKITADAGIDIDNINIDGTTIALSSGDLTLDVAGNIKLDADDNGEIRYLDGGTQYAAIKKDGNNALFQSIVADGDFIIQGIDGASFVSALTLDMSAAGAATFNSTVTSTGLTVETSADPALITLRHTGNTSGLIIKNFSGGESQLVNVDNGPMVFKTNDTERMRISSTGTVGIGMAPDTNNVLSVKNTSGKVINLTNGVNADLYVDLTSGLTLVSPSTGTLAFGTSNTERLRIDSLGGITAASQAGGHVVFNSNTVDSDFRVAWNSGTHALYVDGATGYVGIGADVPDSLLHLKNTGADVRLTLETGESHDCYINFSGATSEACIGYDATDNALLFCNPAGNLATGEAMRIDSSQNLLVGKTATSFSLAGIGLMANDQILATAASDNALALNRLTTDGDIARFYKDSAQVGSIGVDNNDNFYIGAFTSGHSGFYFGNGSVAPMAAGIRADNAIDLGTSTHRFKALYLSGTAYTGDLLVGKTAALFSDNGVALSATGLDANGWNSFVTATPNASGGVQALNRKSSDGIIQGFYKDGTLVGSLNSRGGEFLAVGAGDTYLEFNFGSNQINPSSGTAARDDAIDLGSSSARFDDIFATNGTIQTSDRNEKQDIEALSDAEQRVAVAAKGLLRKFRWKSSVAEKGDEARIHFGIIAQDLQAAFEAEGLDAGRYAMFINSTWTDEETGEERTRLGIRYHELLAFIIAAI